MTVRFSELPLCEPLLRAVAEEGYETATPVQAEAIPHLCAGRDLLGIAQTGSGKTAGFALPVLDALSRFEERAPPRRPSALVLAPTRELAAQIEESFRTYGKHLRLSTAVIFGGVGQNPQVQKLRRGVDILVATPGRLIDLLDQGHVRLDLVEFFVLDEADHMLDMGFIHAVERIRKTLPVDRQTATFSATFPPEIQRLTKALLRDPVRVEVTAPATTVERIAQHVFFVTKANKRNLLESLLDDPKIERALVFTRTKHGADRVTKHLLAADVQAAAIHGNKAQRARERALKDFRDGRKRVLVATDIAARGIDVDDVTHVINFDLPNVPESYVHRIGRTARAGREGIAYSFCDQEERAYLRDIEKTIGQKVPIVTDHPIANETPPKEQAPKEAKRKGGGQSSGRKKPARGGDRSRPGRGGPDRRPRGGRGPGAQASRSEPPHWEEAGRSGARGSERDGGREGGHREDRRREDRPREERRPGERSREERPAAKRKPAGSPKPRRPEQERPRREAVASESARPQRSSRPQSGAARLAEEGGAGRSGARSRPRIRRRRNNKPRPSTGD